MPKLKRNDLIKQEAYINGKWVNAPKHIAVHNPVNGDMLAEVPELSVEQLEETLVDAEAAFKEWKQCTAHERSEKLLKWHELINDNADDLATILTAEQGKPFKEAKAEIGYANGFVQWFAEEVKRSYGDHIPSPFPNHRLQAIKQPVGVVAAITPWNFPAAMITRKIAPALAAGCTVVVKPASETPLTALALAQLAEEAEIPAGVFNVVTGNAKTIGEVMTQSPIVRKLSFTGSTEVGRLLLEQCAATVKSTSMELGGNAPFIVFESADIDKAVEGLIASKFRASGQTCICPNRVFVAEEIYEEFIAALTPRVEALSVGDGLHEEVDMGPLISEEAVEQVEKLLKNAEKAGASIVYGGKRHKKGGNFFEPTIIKDTDDTMDISCEEIFGPVVAISPFETEEEVIRRANDTIYGLASYFYSEDYRQITRVAEALEYGMVGINEGKISTPVAPFGGVKQSGIGREGSYQGLEAYYEIK